MLSLVCGGYTYLSDCRFLHPPGIFKDSQFVNGRFGVGLPASVADVGHGKLHDHISSLAHALDEIWLACRFEEPPWCSLPIDH